MVSFPLVDLVDQSYMFRALETFTAQGIEFVSFSEQLDTSTPADKLVFSVRGAVAELERSLIVERAAKVSSLGGTLRDGEYKANMIFCCHARSIMPSHDSRHGGCFAHRRSHGGNAL